jgi:hypothetical protein
MRPRSTVVHPYHSAIRFDGYHPAGTGHPVAIAPSIEVLCVSIDEQHVALPKLYGAPAYARPAAPVATVPRPFDPDDLPIDAYQTDDEREFASALPGRAWAPGGAIVDGGQAHDGHHQPMGLRPRALSLKSIAGKLLNGD